jgi:ribA/ribD-fused uncharacterized protein
LNHHTLSALEEIGAVSPLYLRPCVDLLRRVLEAVVSAPSEPKWRRLNVHKLRPKLRTDVALKLLQSVGFEPQDTAPGAEEFMVMAEAPTHEQQQVLKTVRDKLQALVDKESAAGASTSASAAAAAAPFPTASVLPSLPQMYPQEGELIEDDKFVFFWHAPSWPAQWTQVPFVVDGLLYSCPEQFMMAGKAKLFGDHASFAKIMTEANPRVQKKLGQKVTGFVEKTWLAHRLAIVSAATYAKFTQHPAFKARLLATGDKIIAEASPLDSLWGIGMAVSDPLVRVQKQWRGTNLLGVALMNVRERIRKEEAAAVPASAAK